MKSDVQRKWGRRGARAKARSSPPCSFNLRLTPGINQEFHPLTPPIKLSRQWGAPPCEEPGQDHLRCLIRLTVEFYDYLQIGNPGLRQLAKNQFAAVNIELDANDLDNQEGGYSIESIFSGIDSFASVTHTYSILIGATKSRIQWGNLSPQTLKVEFVAMFYDFELEVDFIKKCRLLLDLFKLQIVFAGMFYDCGM
jgi:hypothetical protein